MVARSKPRCASSSASAPCVIGALGRGQASEHRDARPGTAQAGQAKRVERARRGRACRTHLRSLELRFFAISFPADRSPSDGTRATTQRSAANGTRSGLRFYPVRNRVASEAREPSIARRRDHAGPTPLRVAVALSVVGRRLPAPDFSSSCSLLGRGRRYVIAGALVEGLTARPRARRWSLLRLLPHVAEGLGGVGALVLFAARVLGARVAFDRAHHRAAARVGRAFIYSALALHSFTDGVGLAAALAITPARGTRSTARSTSR